MSKIQGLVSKIIRFSSVDGPGNRLVIFLQGCNMNCISCHNPHTIGICNYCGICIDECPVKALKLEDDSKRIIFDDTVCVNCDYCLKVCPMSSNPRARWMTVDEIIEEIGPVAPFLSGITISGGEATQQIDFVKEVFTAIKGDSELSFLTNFIDSNGTATIDQWESLLPVMDGAMIDLKALDSKVHFELTGIDNESVLATISYLYSRGKLHEVRLLIISGINDEEKLIKDTVKYLAGVGKDIRVRLIPFRQHGVREEYGHLKETDLEMMGKIKDVFLREGFRDVYIT
ncbi:MAG: YjjW family glycine radical enzyme activase [Halanaerobiales bacterium]|nr:YjjW family glycine radical enzyme activase [Halanaerobiales bacterium]